jgi:hypothetical protein
MSEIPEDVRMAARRAVGNSGASLWENYYEVCDIAARAILAERERCAQAAISVIFNRGGYRDDELIDAIRKGAAL